MDIGSEDEYGKDVGILWAAYKAGSFDYPKGLEQQDFVDLLFKNLSVYDSIWIADDKNRAYPSGRGPVALFGVKADEWVIRPEVSYFKWATKRNILRVIVTFFQMTRYSKDVGLCVFGSTPESRNLYNKMKQYGIFVWHVGNGYFALAGRKECHRP